MSTYARNHSSVVAGDNGPHPLVALVSFALALAASTAILATPRQALGSTLYREPALSQQQADALHQEGEQVAIHAGADKAIYATWHQDDEGAWWATFWTFNYTKVYAREAPAGCGWVFFAANGDGTLTQVIPTDQESAELGQYGPEGVSSHWQELDGSRWY